MGKCNGYPDLPLSKTSSNLGLLITEASVGSGHFLSARYCSPCNNIIWEGRESQKKRLRWPRHAMRLTGLKFGSQSTVFMTGETSAIFFDYCILRLSGAQERPVDAKVGITPKVGRT